jgi:cbb3-type cytochrome oxidase maturation protein
MDILYLLIPISLIIVAIAVWVFMWAIRSGQYEDLEGPAHRILMDDDEHLVPHKREKSADAERKESQ